MKLLKSPRGGGIAYLNRSQWILNNGAVTSSSWMVCGETRNDKGYAPLTIQHRHQDKKNLAHMVFLTEGQSVRAFGMTSDNQPCVGDMAGNTYDDMTKTYMSVWGYWASDGWHGNVIGNCSGSAGSVAWNNISNRPDVAINGSSGSFKLLELSSNTPFIDFHYNNSTLDYTARIIADDNYKLHITASQVVTLQVDGNITNSGTITTKGNITATGFYESSDKRLKSDIKLIDQNFDKVNLYQFKFKNDESQKTKYGVIAQELEELELTDLVSENSDGIKSVDYISLLIGMINDLRKRIKMLESR